MKSLNRTLILHIVGELTLMAPHSNEVEKTMLACCRNECSNRSCLFNPNGVCLAPLVMGVEPTVTADGCDIEVPIPQYKDTRFTIKEIAHAKEQLSELPEGYTSLTLDEILHNFSSIQGDIDDVLDAFENNPGY